MDSSCIFELSVMRGNLEKCLFRNVKDNSAHFQFMLQDGSDDFVHFYPVFRFRKFLLLVRMGF